MLAQISEMTPSIEEDSVCLYRTIFANLERIDALLSTTLDQINSPHKANKSVKEA